MPDNSQIDLDLLIKKVGIKPGMIIADYGCGSGFFVRKVSPLIGKTGIIYAVDVMKEVLLNLQKIANLSGCQNIKTIWSDLERFGVTAIPSDSLDIGFVMNTFSQSNKVKEFLLEVKRMIKPNGRIVVTDWTKEAISMIAPSKESRVDVEDIRKVASEVGGLKELEAYNPTKNHYCIIFQKI